MPFPLRHLPRVAWILGGLVVVVGVGFAAALTLREDRLKPRFEAAASAALGVQVRVGGHLHLSVGRRVLVAAEDLRILDARGAVAASARRLSLWIEPLPLLGGTVRLHRVDLLQPAFDIRRDVSGRTNVEGLRHALASANALDGASLSLVGATLRYSDTRSGAWFAADQVGLSVNRLRFADRKRPLSVRGLAFEATLTCGELRMRNLTMSAIDASAGARQGVIELAPVRMRVLGGQASGALLADLTRSPPRLEVRCSLADFRSERLFVALSGKPSVSGRMGFTAHVITAGNDCREWIANSSGEVSLRGRGLTLAGYDIDRRLSRFESTQGFNFADVGAAVLAGPIGLAATRSYSFSGLLRGSGKNSDIEQLASDWVIGRGVAHARDVALSTRKHRLALQGDLDLVHQRFVDVSVAVVDPGGCARARQALHGSFTHPVLEQPRLLTSMAGPVLNLYKRVRGLLPARPCTVYYSGSVPPPAE